MGIEKVTNNLEKTRLGESGINKSSFVKNRICVSNIQDSVNFQGAASASEKVVLKDILPRTIKFMNKIHENMGEIQNQCINALGTGLIAPLFIMFNPISDTDKDTRVYTAWRQPISAVLAVLTQTAIVIPFNKLIKNLSDIGYLPNRYNATLFPSDDALKAEIKNNNLNKTVSELKAEKWNKLQEMISNDKIEYNVVKDGKSGSSKEIMAKEDFNKLFNEALEETIDSEKNERAKLFDVKLPKKLKRARLFNENPDLCENILNRINSSIVSLKDDPNANSKLEKEIKTIIKELKNDSKVNYRNKSINNDLTEALNEILDINYHRDGKITLDARANKVNKMIDHLNTYKNMDSSKISEYITSIINKRAAAIDGTIDTINTIKKQLASETGIKVKDAQKIIDDVIKNGVFDNEKWDESIAGRLSSKMKSIPEAIAKQFEKNVKSNIDGMKRWTGLGVSLAILPFTCWLLNKLYPLFMDTVFPELSNKKNNKPKKGDMK